MNSFHFCCVCPQSPSATKEYQQFFESINPSSEFNDDEEALQTYLYERSHKLQSAKGYDKTPDLNVKNKRSHLLKSPAIKPKSNVYTIPQHHQESTTPSAPPLSNINEPRSAFLIPTKDDCLMTVDSNHIRQYTGEGAPNIRKMPAKIGLLPPPPTYPRRTSPKPLLIPSAPPQHLLQKMQPHSPLSTRTPSTPKSANRTPAVSDAFTFPSAEPSGAHLVCNSCDVNNYERPRSAEVNSPSSSSPPALPPRRGSHVQMTPPPLPPKPNRGTSSPPPLPPKTYKQRLNSPEFQKRNMISTLSPAGK